MVVVLASPAIRSAVTAAAVIRQRVTLSGSRNSTVAEPLSSTSTVWNAAVSRKVSRTAAEAPSGPPPIPPEAFRSLLPTQPSGYSTYEVCWAM